VHVVHSTLACLGWHVQPCKPWGGSCRLVCLVFAFTPLCFAAAWAMFRAGTKILTILFAKKLGNHLPLPCTRCMFCIVLQMIIYATVQISHKQFDDFAQAELEVGNKSPLHDTPPLCGDLWRKCTISSNLCKPRASPFVCRPLKRITILLTGRQRCAGIHVGVHFTHHKYTRLHFNLDHHLQLLALVVNNQNFTEVHVATTCTLMGMTHCYRCIFSLPVMISHCSQAHTACFSYCCAELFFMLCAPNLLTHQWCKRNWA